jgi:hypothetical protein
MLEHNGPNKLECYITLGCQSLSETNTVTYWAHLLVTKRIKCCEYDSRPHGLQLKLLFKLLISSF